MYFTYKNGFFVSCHVFSLVGGKNQNETNYQLNFMESVCLEDSAKMIISVGLRSKSH